MSKRNGGEEGWRRNRKWQKEAAREKAVAVRRRSLSGLHSLAFSRWAYGLVTHLAWKKKRNVGHPFPSVRTALPIFFSIRAIDKFSQLQAIRFRPILTISFQISLFNILNSRCVMLFQLSFFNFVSSFQIKNLLFGSFYFINKNSSRIL